MRLLNFKAQNLFSLGNVELDLANRGLLLITGYSEDEKGANGSGKSSLSNKGILWTLFGSTASGDKADAVINRFAGKDASTFGCLDFEARDGTQYRIIRSRNPSKLNLIELATGKDVSAKHDKDTQALIDRAIGRTRESFLQTDFFGQGRSASFLDLTAKAQVEIIEGILPFEQLQEYAEKIKGYIKKVGVIENSIQRKVAEFQGKVMEATRQERVLSQQMDEWDDRHLTYIAGLEKEIEASGIVELDTQIEDLQNQILALPTEAEVDAQINYLNTLIQQQHETLESLHETLKMWTEQYNALPTLTKPENNTCPTCNKAMLSEEYQKCVNTFEEVQRAKAILTDSIESWKFEVKNRERVIERHHADIFKCNENTVQRSNLLAKLATIQVEKFSNKAKELQVKLDELKSQTNPYIALYDENSSNLKGLTQSFNFQKTRAEEIVNERKALEFWQGAFNKELKNEFIQQVCPFLETQTNQHLEGLGNGQIKVKVSTNKTLKSNEERSEFNVSVASQTGGNSYEALSGGEKQLVNFAFGLALADLAETQASGASTFMVLDEPFVALDARNSENFVQYINAYLLQKKETILLVSNEDSLKDLIPNKIEVVKEQGITRINNGSQN